MTSKDFAKLEMERKAELAQQKQQQNGASLKKQTDPKPGQPGAAPPQSKQLFHKDVFVVRYQPREPESQDSTVRSQPLLKKQKTANRMENRSGKSISGGIQVFSDNGFYAAKSKGAAYW